MNPPGCSDDGMEEGAESVEPEKDTFLTSDEAVVVGTLIYCSNRYHCSWDEVPTVPLNYPHHGGGSAIPFLFDVLGNVAWSYKASGTHGCGMGLINFDEVCVTIAPTCKCSSERSKSLEGKCFISGATIPNV